MKRKKVTTDQPLTYDDLANAYDAAVGGRKARTLPFDVITEWAKKSGQFIVKRGMFYMKDAGEQHENV